MLRFITSNRFKISVYEGISPSLLATMSLAVNLNGESHEQLIKNIFKANIVHCPTVIKTLHALDRQIFTTSLSPYKNKPYPISKGQAMTDIFTHSIILNTISQHLSIYESSYQKEKIAVLDIGTGHGYLAFAVEKLLQEKVHSNIEIFGVDMYEEAIEHCNKLSKSHFNSKVNFHFGDLWEFLNNEHKEFQYDIIIGGFYIDEESSLMLKEKLKFNGIGIWAGRSEQGQALYKVNPNKLEEYIMETMFSMPEVKTSVAKFFIESGKTFEEKNDELVEIKVKTSTIQEKNREKEILKAELKEALEKHRDKEGKLLKLNEMQKIPEINAILIQMKRFK